MSEQDTHPNRFLGTEPDPVPNGGILNIRYADPEQAGQTVEVRACDADDPTDTAQCEIRLRGNGQGQEQLIVPTGWGAVVLQSDRSQPHRVDVALPP